MRDHPRPAPKLGIALAAFLVASLVGCGDGPQSESSVEHPIRDSLSLNPDEAIVIRSEEAPPTSGSLREFVGRLDGRTVTARIGAFDGDPAYVFGDVVDAHFLPDGSLAVLDGQADSVRVFDPEGVHRYSIGGPGEGPGELSFPVSLVRPVEDELWVVDGSQMIHRFAESDGRLVFEDRVRIDGFPRNACAASGWAVLNVPAHAPGALQTEILHLFDDTGTRQGSFAAPYRYTQRLVFDRMSRGSVACADERVFLGLESLNRLLAYGVPDGQLLWHASFEGIHIPRIRERVRPDGRRAIRTDVPEEGPFHVLLGVVGGDGVPLLVQYGRRTGEDVRDGVDRYVVETFTLDPRTGHGAYLGDDLGQVLAAGEDRLAFLDPDPYPRIEVVRLGG